MSDKIAALLMEHIKLSFLDAEQTLPKVNFLHWGTPIVTIQNILSSIPPSRTVQLLEGVHNLSNKEYEKKMKKWRKNLVGGKAELFLGRKEKRWYPPEGSFLYELYKQPLANNTRKYYLLLHAGEFYFLLKEAGKENSLYVLSKDSKDVRVHEALEAILNQFVCEAVTS